MAYKQAADEVGLTIAEVGVWRNTLDINLYAQLATAENPRMRNFPIIQPCPKLVIRYVLRLHLVLAGDGHEVGHELCIVHDAVDALGGIVEELRSMVDDCALDKLLATFEQNIEQQ